MNLSKALILSAALLLSFVAVSPSAQADTCAMNDDLQALEPAVCGAALYAFCLADGAPKETLSRVTKDCDVSILG